MYKYKFEMGKIKSNLNILTTDIIDYILRSKEALQKFWEIYRYK